MTEITRNAGGGIFQYLQNGHGIYPRYFSRFHVGLNIPIRISIFHYLYNPHLPACQTSKISIGDPENIPEKGLIKKKKPKT